MKLLWCDFQIVSIICEGRCVTVYRIPEYTNKIAIWISHLLYKSNLLTRLETRTKECNACASLRRCIVDCVMKVYTKTFFVMMPNHAFCGVSIVRLLLLWEVRDKARSIRPERWWAIPAQGEARGNSGGSSQRYWRANRSSDVGIGAKDLSNHLVAGSLRSFPQDSWNVVAVLSGKAND